MVQYLAAFRNEKGHGPVAQLFSDDPNEIDEFVAKHYRAGFAVYRCVSPLKDSATRHCLDDVARIERSALTRLQGYRGDGERGRRQAAAAATAGDLGT